MGIMDFIDEVRTRSGRFAKRVDHLETEEATKSALVLPFIQMLGYEIFDPTEVVPEFTVGGPKKGEKVDYALMKDGKPTILIECKKYGTNLDQEKTFQLIRYFAFTEAKFGILTDGIVYRFFSDLDKPNIMDAKPFFEFNMLDFSESGVEELKRFTKSAFNVEETVKAAATLKYTRGMKQAIARQFSAPDDEFVRWLARQVYSKPFTQQARERFTVLAKQALREFVNDRIKATLETALEEGEAEVESETAPEATRDQDRPTKTSGPIPPMRFPDLHIPEGAEIHFTGGNAVARVASANTVIYEGQEYRITPLTKQLRGSDKPFVATRHWTYEGRTLREIQTEVWSRE